MAHAFGKAGQLVVRVAEGDKKPPEAQHGRKVEGCFLCLDRSFGLGTPSRLFLNAVFWILRTGAPWRDLPPDYGDWKNTHRRFCRWRDKGLWEGLLEKLIVDPDYEWLMIDASHIKVHPHASGARGGNEAMDMTKGGSTPRYIWPWMRMAIRSESLLQQVPRRTVRKLEA